MTAPAQPHPALDAGSDSEQMFDLAPVSLWLEDFIGICALLADLLVRDNCDLATFMRMRPKFGGRCGEEIRTIDAKRHTRNGPQASKGKARKKTQRQRPSDCSAQRRPSVQMAPLKSACFSVTFTISTPVKLA